MDVVAGWPSPGHGDRDLIEKSKVPEIRTTSQYPLWAWAAMGFMGSLKISDWPGVPQQIGNLNPHAHNKSRSSTLFRPQTEPSTIQAELAVPKMTTGLADNRYKTNIPPLDRGHTSALQSPPLGSRPTFRVIPPFPPPDDDEEVSRPPPPGAIFEYDPITPSGFRSNPPYDDELRPRQPLDVRFQLGMRCIRATSSPVNRVHPHVVRLRLEPDFTATLIGTFAGMLPQRAQHWVKTRWPEWFLPRTVILKKRKPDWDEEFANEVYMYAKLRPLQGLVIPVCYGQVSCGRGSVPALVLSDTGGVELCDPKAGGLPIERMSNLLRELFKALASHGVDHGDIKLDNFHLVGGPNGRVMAVDLESAEEADPSKLERSIGSDVRFLLGIYRRHQAALVEDGLVPREAYPNLDELTAPDFTCFLIAQERKLSE